MKHHMSKHKKMLISHLSVVTVSVQRKSAFFLPADHVTVSYTDLLGNKNVYVHVFTFHKFSPMQDSESYIMLV